MTLGIQHPAVVDETKSGPGSFPAGNIVCTRKVNRFEVHAQFFTTRLPGYIPVFCHAANAQASLNGSFPVIASYNLEKTKVTLPADFQGQVNLIFLTFESEQQKAADTWAQV